MSEQNARRLAVCVHFVHISLSCSSSFSFSLNMFFGESRSYFDLVVSVHIFLPQRKIEYTSSLRNVILVVMLILRRLIPYGIQVYKIVIKVVN